MKKVSLIVVGLLAAAWIAYGAVVWRGRADRPAAPPGEMRGAWHVHTTRSDGRGALDEVVRAAREAGLHFVVLAEHNVLAPEDGGWRDGVLVITATEASTEFGHVVALGVSRALQTGERRGDPLGAIAQLGGEAVLAHPLHPRRPFTGWGRGAWRGFEVVSNDTAWHQALADRAAGRIVTAALAMPWDPARAVLALRDDPRDELTRFDAELREARALERGPPKVLLCSADAHGYPSYRAAFEAFSMHVPVKPTGDAAADARAVARALLDGSAACVFDGVAPASGIALARGADGAPSLRVHAPAAGRHSFALWRDGTRVGAVEGAHAGGDLTVALGPACGASPCGPGVYRVEATRDGRPWFLTNPAVLE